MLQYHPDRIKNEEKDKKDAAKIIIQFVNNVNVNVAVIEESVSQEGSDDMNFGASAAEYHEKTKNWKDEDEFYCDLNPSQPDEDEYNPQGDRVPQKMME